MARKRQRQELDSNNPRAVDISNILSDMGLQQVNANNTANTNRDHNKRKKKKTKSNTAVGKSSGLPDISLRTQLNYARNGHAVLRNFITDNKDSFSSGSSKKKNSRLSNLREDILDLAMDQELKAWVQKVQVAAGKDIADSCHTIDDCKKALQANGVTANLPFLQYFNTWRKLPAVKDLAFELGKAASILLDVPTVRLYQDAVFWKRSQDGPTPWHVDARMAPFDTSHMITFWIPLQDVPSPENGGTALIFCSKSHADYALPYWNPLPQANGDTSDDDNLSPSGWDRLGDRYPKKEIEYMPMSLGDVTVHSGWTLHCSNGNELAGSKDRVALAITFVDGAAEIRPDWQSIGDDEDQCSYQEWCINVKPRTKFTHELVPITWPPS
ncbi:unnamed protein product [Pseudo-nitzschia multistriata]|uniref:Phytanoyl-CoA dioxygenase n=1 Tax=Pseudo-nitzschia multistriata TaxID=183589 RepID=A0A448ZHI9_9STRA|nr:unnamed protein product [Pseudo-nitzschia multistriata]